MTQEQLRMQMLAGIITEGQYKAQLNENAGNWNNFWKKFLDKELSILTRELPATSSGRTPEEEESINIIKSYQDKNVSSLSELVDSIADLDYDLTEEAGYYPGDFYDELKEKIKEVSDEINFPYTNEILILLSKIPTYSNYLDNEEEEEEY